MQTKNYKVSLTFNVIGCKDINEALQQFLEVIERKDYKDKAFTFEEVE